MIKKGSAIKVKWLKKGVTANGKKWQLFTHQENKKNKETGAFYETGRYTISPNNILNIKDGDVVVVSEITAVNVTKNFSNGKEYNNVLVNCVIEKTEPYSSVDSFHEELGYSIKASDIKQNEEFDIVEVDISDFNFEE